MAHVSPLHNAEQLRCTITGCWVRLCQPQHLPAAQYEQGKGAARLISEKLGGGRCNLLNISWPCLLCLLLL